MSRWVFMLAFALVFYGNGAAFVESFVNYPSWHLIGANEFIAYHAFIGPRVIAFLVAPAVTGTLVTLLLFWFRPAAIPLWWVWTVVILQTVIWISTATIRGADSTATRRQWLLRAARRPAHRDQLVASENSVRRVRCDVRVDGHTPDRTTRTRTLDWRVGAARGRARVTQICWPSRVCSRIRNRLPTLTSVPSRSTAMYAP